MIDTRPIPCLECGRMFDTWGNEDDAYEWAFGHDCEEAS